MPWHPQGRLPHNTHTRARRQHTSLPCAASANASCVANVLLPTPPLPDSTSSLFLTRHSRAAMAARSAQRTGVCVCVCVFWGGGTTCVSAPVGCVGHSVPRRVVVPRTRTRCQAWCLRAAHSLTRVWPLWCRGAHRLVGTPLACGRLARLLTGRARAVCRARQSAQQHGDP
jgi:hypothetical protein